MCLRNLFNGLDCTWLLFIIVILLLIENSDCGCNNGCMNDYNTGCGGCGCGC